MAEEYGALPVHVRGRLAVDHVVGRRLLPPSEGGLCGAARRDAAGLCRSVEYSPSDPSKPVALFVVNDEPRAFAKARVEWRMIEQGQRDKGGHRDLDIPADSVLAVANLGILPAIAQGHVRLEVTVQSAQGDRLG